MSADQRLACRLTAAFLQLSGTLALSLRSALAAGAQRKIFAVRVGSYARCVLGMHGAGCAVRGGCNYTWICHMDDGHVLLRTAIVEALSSSLQLAHRFVT